MNKEEWKVYFETLHGRQPTLLELKKAIQEGTIQEDSPSMSEQSESDTSLHQQVPEEAVKPRTSLWKKVVTGYKNLSSKKRYLLYS